MNHLTKINGAIAYVKKTHKDQRYHQARIDAYIAGYNAAMNTPELIALVDAVDRCLAKWSGGKKLGNLLRKTYDQYRKAMS